MKSSTIIIISLIILISCKVQKEPAYLTLSDENIKDLDKNVSITVNGGEYLNSPTLAIWLEDADHNYIKTLYVSKS